MNRLGKRIAAVVLSLTLVMGMCSTCFAANWGQYFGGSGEWYEGAVGALTSNTATSWTASMSSVGWGGIWGGQVYIDNAKNDNQKGVKIVKGKNYTLSCTLKSTKSDKWVLIKIAQKDNYAFGQWVKLKKGVLTTINSKFTAKCDATAVYFGLGGEHGDRLGVDADAATRYALTNEKTFDGEDDMATNIEMKNFKITSSLKAVSNKKTNIKNLSKYLKSNGKIYVKKSGYKCTVKRSGSGVSIKVVKGKTLINAKVKTSNYKKVFKKIKKNKKAKKAATVLSKVLKAQTGLTLKNLGY